MSMRQSVIAVAIVVALSAVAATTQVFAGAQEALVASPVAAVDFAEAVAARRAKSRVPPATERNPLEPRK